MMGESIVLFDRSDTATDDFGNPVSEWTATTVDHCLVRPLNGSDANDSQRPDGVTISCTVALPKTFTANTTMERFKLSRVALIERGMDGTDPESALRVSGAPFRVVPCPTYWDTLLECGVDDG